MGILKRFDRRKIKVPKNEYIDYDSSSEDRIVYFYRQLEFDYWYVKDIDRCLLLQSADNRNYWGGTPVFTFYYPNIGTYTVPIDWLDKQSLKVAIDICDTNY